MRAKSVKAALEKPEESRMRLMLEGRSSGKLDSIHIVLEGAISKIPSKGNGRRALRSGFVVSSNRVTEWEKEFKSLYVFECMRQRLLPVSFEKELVTVSVRLAPRPGRFDSHNAPKVIGDMLGPKGIAVYDDDSQAEVFAFKKADYPALYRGETSTDIIIKRRKDYPWVDY